VADARTVLFLHSSAGRYGADRQLEMLATGLDPARYRALVVLPDHGELGAALRGAGVEVRVRPLAVIRRALATPGGAARIAAAWAADARALAALARGRGAAVIHTNTSVTVGGAPAARLAGIPHVWHLRETFAEFPRAWPAFRRLLLTADAVPCLSQATLDQLGGAPQGRLLHEGIPELPDPPPRAEARGALGLDPAAFVVALPGRVIAWKGHAVLIRALADARLRDGGAIGLLAGRAWPEEEAFAAGLDTLAAELGVAGRVRRLGHVEDIAGVYAAADVVVVPSTAPEPLGLVALEAAALGRCVVAAAHGGLTEIVRDGETGRLVEPGDPAALAAVLAELAAAPERREALGAAAAVDVRARFSTAALLEATQALYDEVLRER